ncbi:hypothetical protein ETAA8_64480 [Anatilimnocola aggregata]|uniref:Uncharacterized protein n=1 Tax=Anatilimnocola aggregata TaxID=2528021 RepID=A0A517YM53_9BACT|nr:hypothetical protein [Anatilimnocola aggregata]QDU31295.1 hypothetical protein ETAA8_64480 [Anatilimnocola aggregata]
MESNQPRTSAGFGPLKDLHNLKNNGSASLAELKEFLGKLQGRSPQEVVGLVSTSLLVQSMVISVIGTIALLAVFTIGPYMIYGAPEAKKTAAAPPVAAAPAAAPAAETAKTDAPVDDKTRAMKALGIDETKESDPNANPLENKLDNLLDNVK